MGDETRNTGSRTLLQADVKLVLAFGFIFAAIIL